MKLKNFPKPSPEPHLQTRLEHMQEWDSAPCGVSKDSNPLTRANFDAMCDMFDDKDPMGTHWEIVRFPHWKTKWLELVFYRPDSVIAELADQLRKRMGDYPCLDEDLWVEYEGQGMTQAEYQKESNVR